MNKTSQQQKLSDHQPGPSQQKADVVPTLIEEADRDIKNAIHLTKELDRMFSSIFGGKQ